MAKRKNDIAHMNHKIIQENEKFIKEQKIKMRELANIENAEIFKKQVNSIFQMCYCLPINNRVNLIDFQILLNNMVNLLLIIINEL